MASLIQGLRNFKANLGTAASEMQHIANQLQGSGADEKKFLEAVAKGEVQVAANLLTVNPNVIYARTKDWLNAWHIAAQAGSLPMLEVLYTHGRGATRKPLPGEPPHYAAKTRDKRETPLMLACANTHLTAMHYLLGVGASTRETDKYGNTILHYAALKGQVKMLAILLAADEGRRQSDTGSQGIGIGKGLSLNSPNTRLLDMRNEAGLQPLHFAVWGGHKDAVLTMLMHRPDLIAKSTTDSMAQVTCNGGSTPLHVAALKNDPAMVDLLLNEYIAVTNEGRGPRQDPRLVQDNYKFTPHGLAMDLKREAVLPLLDPQHVLKGLDIRAAAAAAAGVAYVSQGSLRRSITGGRSSRASSDPGVKDGKLASAEDDGFAALAAGLDKQKERNRRTSNGDSPVKVIVPPLQPPPPPSAKVRKASGLPPRPISLPCSPTASPAKPLAGKLTSAEHNTNGEDTSLLGAVDEHAAVTCTTAVAVPAAVAASSAAHFCPPAQQQQLTATALTTAAAAKETSVSAATGAVSKPVVAVRAAAAAAAAQHIRTAIAPASAHRNTEPLLHAAVPTAVAQAPLAVAARKKMQEAPETPTVVDGEAAVQPKDADDASPAHLHGGSSVEIPRLAACHDNSPSESACPSQEATAGTLAGKEDQEPSTQQQQQQAASAGFGAYAGGQHIAREYSLMPAAHVSDDCCVADSEVALIGHDSAAEHAEETGGTAVSAEHVMSGAQETMGSTIVAESYCSSYVAVDAMDVVGRRRRSSASDVDVDGKRVLMSASSGSHHAAEHSEAPPYGIHVITAHEVVTAEAYHAGDAVHSRSSSVSAMLEQPSSEPTSVGLQHSSMDVTSITTPTMSHRSSIDTPKSGSQAAELNSSARITPKASISSQGSGHSGSGSHVGSQATTTSSSAARAAAAASVVVVEPVTPLELTCPITNQLFEHPVIAEDGS